MANLAIPRENRPFSFCQLANLRASDNSSGTSTIKDDEIVSSTAGGGQSTSTDTATIAEWDRRAKDNYFSALDNSWSSATTTRAGGDAEGNPSLSQSIVEAWENDYRWQLDDYTDSGNEGWSHHQETDTTRESGYNSQTATISGPEEKRRQTLAIDSAFESLVESEQRDEAYLLDEHDPDYSSYSWSKQTTRNEESGSSSYHSSHTADAAGRATGGKFSSSSKRTVKAVAPQRGPDGITLLGLVTKNGADKAEYSPRKSPICGKPVTKLISFSRTYAGPPHRLRCAKRRGFFTVPPWCAQAWHKLGTNATVSKKTALASTPELDQDVAYNPHAPYGPPKIPCPRTNNSPVAPKGRWRTFILRRTQ